MTNELLKDLLKDIAIVSLMTLVAIPCIVITGTSISFLEATIISLIAFSLITSYTVWRHKKRARICKNIFAPLFFSCELMISEFEDPSLKSLEIEKNKHIKASCQQCYIVLKEIIYADLINAHQKLLKKQWTFRGTGLSCTPTALTVFDEQSDFVRKILELDKILNPKPKKEKKK